MRQEFYLIDIHCISIRVHLPYSNRGPLLWGIFRGDIGVPLPEISELYHVPVKFSSLIEPLLPFPYSDFLTCRESGSGYHGGQLKGDPSLESIHQNAV